MYNRSHFNKHRSSNSPLSLILVIALIVLLSFAAVNKENRVHNDEIIAVHCQKDGVIIADDIALSHVNISSDGSDARLSYYTASSFVSLDFKGASCTITNADD